MYTLLISVFWIHVSSLSSASLVVVVSSVVVVVVHHLHHSIGVGVVVAVRVVDVRLHHIDCLAAFAEDEEGDATCDDEQDSKCASCYGQNCLLVLTTAVIC